MKYCTNCGNQLDLISNFCDKCGNKIESDKILNQFISSSNSTAPKINSTSEFPWVHYVLVPINVLLPWSVVSWIGIPMALLAKKKLKESNSIDQISYKKQLLWTNISLAIFIFYLVISIFRALWINGGI